VAADRDVIRTGHAVLLASRIPNARLLIVPGNHGDYLGELVAAAGESVAVVVAMRGPDAGQDLAGLAELVVSGLPDGAAQALLESVITGPLDEQVRDRIVAETRGNPLALLDLARGLIPGEPAGGIGLPRLTAVPGRIEEGFRRR
jgi:hypothetical protein